MAEDLIPTDLRRFILTSIDSVPYLETLLLFHRNQGESWGVKEVSGLLFVSEGDVAEALDRLRGAGFLSVSGRENLVYSYSPRSPAQGQMVDRLALVYAKHLIEITNLIHSKSGQKVRQFAEAFKLRKE